MILDRITIRHTKQMDDHAKQLQDHAKQLRDHDEQMHEIRSTILIISTKLQELIAALQGGQKNGSL
jgi:hypothetical protein